MRTIRRITAFKRLPAVKRISAARRLSVVRRLSAMLTITLLLACISIPAAAATPPDIIHQMTVTLTPQPDGSFNIKYNLDYEATTDFTTDIQYIEVGVPDTPDIIKNIAIPTNIIAAIPPPEPLLLLPLPPDETFPGPPEYPDEPPEYPDEPELPPILFSSSLEKDERAQTILYNSVFSPAFISLVIQTACPELVSSGCGVNSCDCSIEVSSTTFISLTSA